MSTVNVPISEGTRVFLNFSVSLEDGSEVDTNFGGDPVDTMVVMRVRRVLIFLISSSRLFWCCFSLRFSCSRS